MGGYDFPGQIASSDGSECNGSMGAGFIVLENPKTTDNLVVMVDIQSILRENSRWVDEGDRTLSLSVNPDILRMVIGRLTMRIA